MGIEYGDAGKKKEISIIVLKVLILLVLVSLAYKSFYFAGHSKYAAIVLVPIFVFWLILIGIILGDFFGGWFGGHITSFFFSSGGTIAKPKDYSKPRSLVIQNKLKEAIEEYQKILKKDKTDIIVYSELGEIYYERLKDFLRAFNCYDKMEKYAKETPDIIFAINRKADIYLNERNYSEAIKELKKITKKFPKTKDAFYAQVRIQNLKKTKLL